MTGLEALRIIAKRMEERADGLERVGMDGYEVAIHELRVFADMTRRAAKYLESTKS